MAGDTRSTQVLFREWRGGDAEAGQIMAQRFADWYYAISTSRLGESAGRVPCETACARFGEGIVQVTDARELINWAHQIVQTELDKAGSRARDGDEANAYTGNQSPKTLLAKARGALQAEVELLEATYSGSASPEQIEELAAPLGGNPLGVLKARYRVKQWLRDNAGVPFEVAPDNPVLDRAPLPLYESARMATPEEEASFEHWMISDIDLCKDIAEFAHFSIALRGGLPTEAEVAAAPPAAKKPVPSSNQPAADAGGGGAKVGAAAAAGGFGLLALAAVGIVTLVLLAGAGYYFFMM